MVTYDQSIHLLDGLTFRKKDGRDITLHTDGVRTAFVIHNPRCVRKIHRSRKTWGWIDDLAKENRQLKETKK